MKNLIKQLSKFASVGGLATAVHAVVYTVVGGHLDPMLANLIAFLVAFIFSYIGHFLWTFRAQTKGQEVHKAVGYQIRFLTVAVMGLLLNSMAVWAVTDLFNVDYLFALVPMIFMVPLLTFALAKFWAFK
jgi:putative flippase GtrA